jgi:maleylacetoacetate isomerase/maleylpyruvate isomerase
VPTLETDAGELLSQSMAIIEYLDETHPEPPLLPRDALGPRTVRALAQLIACEIHPLNNLRVLKYLVRDLKVDEDTKNTWYRHWVRTGSSCRDRNCSACPRAPTATATRPRWPTAAWCRRSSMRKRFEVDLQRPHAHRGAPSMPACASGVPEGAALELPGQRRLRQCARSGRRRRRARLLQRA